MEHVEVLSVEPSDMICNFNHKHIINIADLSADDITVILDLANIYVKQNRTHTAPYTKLQGMCLINVFFENSTRTLISFELAGKRLGMHTLNMGVENSSIAKGESLKDTFKTLSAMLADVIVVRHSQNGIIQMLSEMVDCPVINGGDGTNAHPTQALLDALTIRRKIGRLHDITVAICGDVTHSRVARSNIVLLNKMGAKVRIVAPKELIPKNLNSLNTQVDIYHNMQQGLKDCDIVMALRVQKERMQQMAIPDTATFFDTYGLTHEKLVYARPNALVMHPGPINRGIEISGKLADDTHRALINYQVEMGVAVRMACLDLLTKKSI